MTNAEIALQLGISPSTLSLVINQRPRVASETRARVISALKDMGMEYLIKNPHTGKPALLSCPNLCFAVFRRKPWDFSAGRVEPYVSLMEACQTAAMERGFNLFFLVMEEEKPIEEYLRKIKDMNVCGILLYSLQMKESDFPKWADVSCPVVCLGQGMNRTVCTSVTEAAASGAFQVITDLIRLGHRRIGYLRSSIRRADYRERERGYISSLTGYGLSFRSEDIWDLPPSPYPGSLTIAAILDGLLPGRSLPDLPTAFVSDEDFFAYCALKAFRQAGIRVPEDISLTGYTAAAQSCYHDPELATVLLDPDVYAAAALSELQEMMQAGSGENHLRKIQLVPVFKPGKTIGKPAQKKSPAGRVLQGF